MHVRASVRMRACVRVRACICTFCVSAFVYDFDDFVFVHVYARSFCYLIFIFENTHQNKRIIIHEDMKYIYNSNRHVITIFHYKYLLT